MPEEDLKTFIPKYGDRAAIKKICKKHSLKNKQSLIERLRSKIEKTDYEKRKATDDVHIKKRNTKKSTRFIEIDWFCMFKKENRYCQVRAKCGGGTRRITIDRNSVLKY
ncbi:hypothetical protein NQ314_004020 [Rhamnusium bicolor]|uniref:SAP domain-containing protein n=1 Tax=Rhamnusium bicolor TaxID=1586634 RepID=A0AAV8ZKH7_9CUCU|nr:hypothetical protein NQ314_004020 [Rhamnusium bicolor]